MSLPSESMADPLLTADEPMLAGWIPMLSQQIWTTFLGTDFLKIDAINPVSLVASPAIVAEIPAHLFSRICQSSPTIGSASSYNLAVRHVL